MCKKIIWDILFKNDVSFVMDQICLDEEIAVIKAENTSLQEQIITLNDTYADMIDYKDEEIGEKDAEITKLKAQVPIVDPLEDYWNNKYTKAKIVYTGRSFPFSTDACPVPVNVMLTPEDPFIIQDLKDWGLIGDNNTDWETQIPKIYKKIKEKYYHYAYTAGKRRGRKEYEGI